MATNQMITKALVRSLRQQGRRIGWAEMSLILFDREPYLGEICGRHHVEIKDALLKLGLTKEQAHSAMVMVARFVMETLLALDHGNRQSSQATAQDAQ